MGFKLYNIERGGFIGDSFDLLSIFEGDGDFLFGLGSKECLLFLE
jgi:hypothetical protein